MAANKKQLEARLSHNQKKAALLLVERELSSLPEIREMTLEEIADECNISRMQLYRYRQNTDFIEYTNLLADDFLSDKRVEVYKQLMKLINSPQPSVNAIKLFMQRFELLTEKRVIEETTSSRSKEDIEKELDDLDELLGDDDE